MFIAGVPLARKQHGVLGLHTAGRSGGGRRPGHPSDRAECSTHESRGARRHPGGRRGVRHQRAAVDLLDAHWRSLNEDYDHQGKDVSGCQAYRA